MENGVDIVPQTYYNTFEGEDMEIFIVLIITAIIIAIVAAARSKGSGSIFEAPERRAGRIGERQATNLIKEFLLYGDHLFTNVHIEYDGRPAELDNVVVNQYGVFIIEVKTYKGCLVGGAEDYEWQKHRMTDAGNIYTKSVKNPIRQVKRQVFLLARYLKYCGVDVWINGYVFLLYGNSPVESEYIISELNDIGKKIHTPGRKYLTQKQIDAICKLLLVG